MNGQISLFPYDTVKKAEMKKKSKFFVKERLELYGSSILLNHEIISFLSGVEMDKAEEICSKHSLQELVTILDDKELQLTEKQTHKLKMLFEFSKRVSVSFKNNIFIKSPGDVSNMLMEELRYLKKECFITLLLDTKNRLIRKEYVSIGTLNSSLVHPREVFNMAIKLVSSGIILVHNHPSGSPEASSEDITTTERLKSAGEILGIGVLDHVIIGDGRWYSFKESGLI